MNTRSTMSVEVIPEQNDDVEMTPSTSKSEDVNIGVISTTTPELKSQDVCIADGCNNASVQHPEWDNEYCSVSCTYKHCKSTFIAWLANNKYAKMKAMVAAVHLNEAVEPDEEQPATTSTTP